MATKTSIQKRRRLQELYAKGVEVRFGPEGVNPETHSDEDIVVWVTPPDQLQREQVLREAQAARARAMLTAKRNDESPDAVQGRAVVDDMGLETLIDYVLTVGEQERQQEATREVLKNPEWEDFTALQDAMRQWEEAGSPEDDEEWKALLDKDREFGRQVREEADRLRDSAREALAMLPRPELEERAFKKRVDLVGQQAFVQEYERRMLFFACRDDEDHRQLFFESVEELLSMDDQVQEALAEALAGFIQDAREAKNSPRAETGSEQSEPPEEPETSESSTLQAVSA